jgi:Ca2+-binding EF-hand superfamily protein
LDIDEDFDGFIIAEDFAKVIGGASGSSRYDFNIIKMLINMRNKNKNNKINYSDFS